MTVDTKALELALAGLNKDYGPGTISRLGDQENRRWPAISTGALTLDLAIGIGGLPRGRIVEVYGPESSGKTTLALMVVAEAQRLGGICAYVDAEHALDPVYAENLGCDLKELLISQPDTGEDALNIVDRLVRTGAVSVIVVDSVAALTPKAELEGEVGDNHVGRQPRMMAQALRIMNSNISKTDTLVIFINQIREKIGVMFGSPETTPGGRALKFYSSVRIDIRKVEQIKDKDTGEFLGVKTKAKIVKNKMAPPYREAIFDIRYGKGIDRLGCTLDAAENAGIVIKNSGNRYLFGDEQLGHGRANAITGLASDLELAEKIQQSVLEKAGLL